MSSIRWPWRSRDQTLYDTRFCVPTVRFRDRAGDQTTIQFRYRTRRSIDLLSKQPIFGIKQRSIFGIEQRTVSPTDQPNVLWDIGGTLHDVISSVYSRKGVDRKLAYHYQVTSTCKTNSAILEAAEDNPGHTCVSVARALIHHVAVG